MAIAISVASKSNRAAAINTQIGNSAVLALYTGLQPYSPDLANTGTLLATMTGNATGFGTVSNGTLTANYMANSIATGTGTVGYCRIYKSDGVTAVADLDVNTGGSTLTIGSVIISAGETVQPISIIMTEL